MTTQRGLYRTGALSADRAALLEALSGWTWNQRRATTWDEHYHALERFAAREGHTRVPKSHVEDGYRLGQWVQGQRSFYAAGRLSAERVARLEALPGWIWNSRDAAWEDGFSALERFVAREGHSRVPQDRVDDGYRLGSWVTTQRSVHREGRLSPERAARLEALPGWTWNPNEAAWDRGFSFLRQFVAREGHARIPYGHIQDNYPLGSWVKEQRTLYRAGRLPNDRATRLEALAGWSWNPRADGRGRRSATLRSSSQAK